MTWSKVSTKDNSINKMNNQEVSKNKASANKLGLFIRKNIFSILMGIAIVTMLVSPDAKAWVLRRLMVTGIFNANLDEKSSNQTTPFAVDFDFEDEKGNIQNTSSLREKIVFINFWASWCPPCRAEFPSIEALYARFKDNPDVFFLTINEDDDLTLAKAYLEKENFSVPFYKTKSNVPREIYSGTLPTTVVLDKHGTVRFRHEGFASYGSEKFIRQIEELMR